MLILPAGAKKEGIIFIGPAAETMEAMGDKIAARKRMIAAGVPVSPVRNSRCKVPKRRYVSVMK